MTSGHLPSWHTIRTAAVWLMVAAPVAAFAVQSYIFLDDIHKRLAAMETVNERTADRLTELTAEMAAQTQSLNDLHDLSGAAAAHRNEIARGPREVKSLVSEVRAYMADQLGYHRGIVDRVEGAADRLEALVRGTEAILRRIEAAKK